MLNRCSHMLIRVLAFLVSALVVVSVLATWRLAQGPIAIDALTPYLEQAVMPPDSDLEMRIGESLLRFGGDQVVTCVLLDVEVLSTAGETVLAVPEVEVDFSLSALVLHAAIAPTRVAMSVSRLVLVREPDGSLGLRGGAARQPGAADDPGSRVDLEQLARRLLGASSPERPLSYLQQVEVTGERLILDDRVTRQQVEARAGSLRLERGDTVEAHLDFEIPRERRTIQARARGTFDGRELTLRVDVADLEPADLEPYLARPELSGIDLRLRGQVQTAVDLEGGLGPLTFRLSSVAPGTVDLPEHLTAPLPVERLSASGVLAGDLNAARLDHLVLTTLGATLEAKGRAAWGDDALTVQGEARARNVPVQDFDRLWPTTAAAEARKWAIPNVRDGVVEEAFVAVDIQPGDLDREPIPRTLASGWFSYQDLAVRYFEGFPLIEGIDGKAWFDGWVLAFEGGGGRSRELALESGQVAITGMTVPGKYATRLHVRADVSGPVSDALDLLERQPLGFPSQLGIAPDKTEGTVRTQLQLGLPLYKDVEAEVLEVTARAELQNVVIEDLQGQADVRQGDLQLGIDDGSMTLSGDAHVAEIPLSFSLSESFAEDADAPRRFKASMDLEPASLARLGVPDDLPLAFEGVIGAEIEGSEDEDGAIRLDVGLDLERAQLALPLAGWRKEAGTAGRAEATVAIPVAAPIRIEPLRIESDALDVRGRLRLGRQPLGLELAEFDRLDVGEQRLSARVSRQGEGLEARIRAGTLLLDPLFEVDLGDQDEEDREAPPTPLRIDLGADPVTANGRTLRQVELQAERDATGWVQARLSGRFDGEQQVRASLAPADGHQRLSIESDDAGGLISLLMDPEPIAGGRLELRGRLLRQRPEIDLEGELTIDEFTIKRAPTLARILTLLSAQGIEDVVSGRRLAMTRLELPFHLSGERLALERARTWGSGLGLTAEGQVDLEAETVELTGTVLPAYGLNWAISKIPVIGNFLAGSDGEGAFAATYSIRGQLDEPAVTVNPLTVLAPGFIRDLFAGKGKAPEMLPDRTN